MSKESPAKPEKPARRFWRKKRWWALAVLVAGLVWLDGPGWRWIGGIAAERFLPKLGFEGDFTLEGRLSTGKIRVSDLKLESGSTVQLAELGGLTLEYSLWDLIKQQKAEAIRLDKLHVDVDLAAAAPKEQEPEEEDDAEPKSPAEILADLRARLVPMDIQIRELSATIRDGEETVFSIEPTNLLHGPGSETFQLDLGAMQLPGDRTLTAQTAKIEWKPDRFLLDRLQLLDEVALASLSAEIDDTIDLATRLEVADASFVLATNLDEASLSLGEGSLSVEEIERVAEIELPLEGTIRALDAEVFELAGALETLHGKLALKISDFDYDGWASENVTLEAALAPDAGVTAALRLAPSGSPLALDLIGRLDRSNSLRPIEASATLETPRAAPILNDVRNRYVPPKALTQEQIAAGEEAPAERPDLPACSLRLVANSTFDDDSLPALATAELRLISSEDAPPLALDARWIDNQTAEAQLRIPGVEIDGRFETEGLLYSGTASLDEFAPDALAPWAAPWGVTLPEGILASLAWKGAGDLEAQTHEGSLDLSRAEWTRTPDQPPLQAFAEAEYDWPQAVTLRSLNVQQGAQKIETRATLADQVLDLSELSWSDGDDVLASGTASIPVPEDIADWKALLREERPISLDFETPELPLSKLHPFLGEDTRFVEGSRAKVEIDLSGTPAAPELVARITADSVGLVSQPDLPLASLRIDATGREQTFKVEGDVTAGDYPPAKIDLVTNWDPNLWAENPEAVKEAKLDAAVDIADLQLASFASFIPDLRELEGTAHIHADVTGTVGKPEPNGLITLDGGKLAMKDDSAVPDIQDGRIRISATPELVTIETLHAEVAGGTLDLGGTLALSEWKPAELDLRLDADSLPAARNNQMIVRVSAGLTLTGPWDSARLGGDVRVVDSLYYKDIELLPIGVPVATVAEPSLPSVDSPPPSSLTAGIPEPFRNWGLDVALKTETPFLIRGNLASGEIYLDARVGGTVANPRPTGGATLREVVAQLPFSKLEIKSGKVTLRPDRPFDPVLDIRGRSAIRPYDITLYIYGAVSDPKIQPTSSPPLPDTEVMTLIATGTTTEGLTDPAAATARATQLLIEEARRGRIGAVRWLRPVFSVLDKVDFQVGETDAYTSKKFNSASFELSDNWLLSAGISEEGNTRSKLTYLFRFR